MWVVDCPIRLPFGTRKKPNRTWALNLNVYRNTHEQTLNKMKILFDEIMQPRLKHLPVMEKVNLIFTLFVSSKQLCDTSNICCIVDKFFSDSLVHAKKIEDDNYTVVLSSLYRYGGQDKSNPHVEVTIEPVDFTGSNFQSYPKEKENDPMRVIFTQEEIEGAIRDRLRKQISVKKNSEIKIEFSATRGDDGLTATIQVQEKAGSPKPAPVVPTVAAKTAGATTAGATGEAPTTGEAPRRRGRPSKAEVAAREAAAAAEAGQTTAQATTQETETQETEVDAEEPIRVPIGQAAAEETVEESVEEAEQPVSEEPTEETTEEEAPASAPKKSIFGNLSRPVNEASE